MSRVVHFEVHADNPERAIDFYSRVFDWEFQRWDGPMEYWLIKTGPKEEPGIDGGLMRRRGEQQGNIVSAFVCSIETKAIDECAAAAVKHGGEVVVPKMPIPGVGWLVYCKDPEGNIFGITQMDANAK